MDKSESLTAPIMTNNPCVHVKVANVPNLMFTFGCLSYRLKIKTERPLVDNIVENYANDKF